MKKPPLHQTLKDLLTYHLHNCPNCGSSTLDRRIRTNAVGRRTAVMSPVKIRAWSHRTIQMECIRCKLRFSVKWATFLSFLKHLKNIRDDDSEDESAEDEKKKYESYQKIIEQLPDYLVSLKQFMLEKNVKSKK